MPRRLAAVAALILATACATASRGAAPDPSRAAAEIRGELDSTAAGWNRGDLAGYLQAYDDSIVSRGADGFVRGKAAAETVMRQGFWRAGRPEQQLRYEHVEVRPLGGGHALVTGQYVLSGAGKPDRTGWFTTVWARTAAGWRMIHDHS